MQWHFFIINSTYSSVPQKLLNPPDYSLKFNATKPIFIYLPWCLSDVWRITGGRFFSNFGPSWSRAAFWNLLYCNYILGEYINLHTGSYFPYLFSLFFDNNRCKPIDLFDNWNKPWQYSESPPGMKFYNWIGEISRLASKTWPKCETKGTISFLVPFFVTELGSSTQTRDPLISDSLIETNLWP